MAKTNEFEIYVKLAVGGTASNTSLDLTDYVDIADNEALDVDEIDIVLDPTNTFASGGAANQTYIFQLADSNIQAFVSHADRTSLYTQQQMYGNTDNMMSHTESFSSLTPLIVNKTLFCRHEHDGATGTIDFTLRIKGKIVKPSAKDYMALVLTQTGNVA
tara:strand:- start:1150 stop:1629 length:480 start_codon:yes stop_codon:yes gene_type:complete